MIGDQLLNIRRFTPGARRRGGHDVAHKGLGGFRRFRHLILQAPCCEAVEAQQTGLLRTQLRHTRDDGARVVVVTLLAARQRLLKQRFARGAHRQRLQHRLLGGILQRD